MPRRPERGARRALVVLSTGRTGTQALARYLAAEFPGEVTALHEPFPSRILRVVSNLALAGRCSVHARRAALRLARDARLARCPTPRYVETNPFLFGFLDVMAGVYPDLAVVHVVRHPEAYVRSHLEFGAFTPAKLAVPFFQTLPDHDPAHRGPTWAEMEPTERLAYRWWRINRELDRGAALLGPRYRRVRFEDLFTPAGLGEVLAPLELPVTEGLLARARAPINTSRARGRGPACEWTPARRARLAAWCADLAGGYGYEL